MKSEKHGAFTVNVALITQRTPTFGVVYAPALDRLFVGSEDGAFTEDADGCRVLRIRPVPKNGPVAVASASHRDGETDAWLRARDISQTRSIGSSLKFCLLAAG